MSFAARCRRIAAALLGVGAAAALVGCSALADGPSPASAGATGATGTAPVYVSIGDSYAAGYQPQSPTTGSTSGAGFAYQVVAKAAMGGSALRLINFGCAGETTTQVVSQNGCQAAALGPGAPTYRDRPQAVAAVDAMRADPGAVKLVTVVMGGNDLTPCLRAAQPQQCVQQAIPVVVRNVSGLLAAVRQVVGPSVKIVGLTYPDPFLGGYVTRTPAAIATASRSLVMFRNYLNPALKQAYTSHGADFVDLTQLSGAYGSLAQTTTLAPYGTLPVPVARACQLTFYCQYADVHPTTAGYAFIADQVLKAR